MEFSSSIFEADERLASQGFGDVISAGEVGLVSHSHGQEQKQQTPLEITSHLNDSNTAAVVCCICGGNTLDGRSMLQFQGVEQDVAAAIVAPEVITFTQNITLHVFCGKTAAILPSINEPSLEIVSKANINNKHRRGNDIDAALARSRSAVALQGGSKGKKFYLRQEFEAHLAAVRQAWANSRALSKAPDGVPEALETITDPYQYLLSESSPSAPSPPAAVATTPVLPKKVPASPIRAEAGRVRKVPNKKKKTRKTKQSAQDTGRIFFCPCGGSYSNSSTPRGLQSFRAHVETRHHQKWAEENGCYSTCL